MIIKILAKATEKRVQDITMGELESLIPTANNAELSVIRGTLRNNTLTAKERYQDIGAVIEVIVYRTMQNQVIIEQQREVKE